MSSSLIVDYLSAGLHKTRPGTDTVGGGTNRCSFLITLSVDCKTITSGPRVSRHFAESDWTLLAEVCKSKQKERGEMGRLWAGKRSCKRAAGCANRCTDREVRNIARSVARYQPSADKNYPPNLAQVWLPSNSVQRWPEPIQLPRRDWHRKVG